MLRDTGYSPDSTANALGKRVSWGSGGREGDRVGDSPGFPGGNTATRVMPEKECALGVTRAESLDKRQHKGATANVEGPPDVSPRVVLKATPKQQSSGLPCARTAERQPGSDCGGPSANRRRESAHRRRLRANRRRLSVKRRRLGVTRCRLSVNRRRLSVNRALNRILLPLIIGRPWWQKKCQGLSEPNGGPQGQKKENTAGLRSSRASAERQPTSDCCRLAINCRRLSAKTPSVECQPPSVDRLLLPENPRPSSICRGGGGEGGIWGSGEGRGSGGRGRGGDLGGGGLHLPE